MEKVILLVLVIALICGCTQTTILSLKSEDITTFSLSWQKAENTSWATACEKCQQNKTFCEMGFNYTLLMNLPEGINEANCKMLYKQVEYHPGEGQFFSMTGENVDNIGTFSLSIDKDNEVVICCGLGNEYKQACRVATLSNKCTMYSINISCKSDSDCVGATCCHPTSCINKAYKGVCNELCTQVCQGPLDCGAGHCGCVDNRCTVIPK